ncbi:hypothetical protein [Streptomyces sp. LN785]|uniref:hypothetical protein n=1 Tax=Streptomyces sp. LN785 TaxID=3112983 RepID=UPI00371D2D67
MKIIIVIQRPYILRPLRFSVIAATSKDPHCSVRPAKGALSTSQACARARAHVMP